MGCLARWLSAIAATGRCRFHTSNKGTTMRGVRVITRHVLLAVALGMLAPSANVAAQATPQNTVALPSADAPHLLGSVTLPARLTTVVDVFGDMPAIVFGELGGAPLRSADRVVITYGTADPQFGSPLALSAISFPDGDFFPVDFTAGAFISMASQTDDYEATAFGQDGGLAWIQSETTVGAGGGKPGTPETSFVLYTLAWGQKDSSLLFTAAATSPSGLNALVTTFVAVIENWHGREVNATYLCW